MNEFAKEVFIPFISQIGLKENTSYPKTGLTFIPEEDLGSGFLWTYPVKHLFCVTVFNLVYHQDISYNYQTSTLLNLSQCSAAVAAPVISDQPLKPQNLIGYCLKNQVAQYTIPKNTLVKSISISIHPDYYNKHLPNLYDRDFDNLPNIISSLDGSCCLPAIDILLNTITQYNPNPAVADLYYEAKLMELIAILSDWHIQEEAAKSSISKNDLQYLNTVTAYIRNHLSDAIDLKTLTSISCMGKTKLSYLFKKVFGITIFEYIHSQRINAAQNFLLNSQYSMQEIAVKVGYHCQSSFSDFFRQKNGCSPLEYRKNAAGIHHS